VINLPTEDDLAHSRLLMIVSAKSLVG